MALAMSNEADTCRKYVLPKLVETGWDDEPHSFTEQRTFTDGRIIVAGQRGVDFEHLYHSSAHVGALLEEEIQPLRQVSGIARNATFEIIEGRDITLSDSDVQAYRTQLADDDHQVVP